MMRGFILTLLVLFTCSVSAGPAVIWGPDSTAQVIAPNGLYPSALRGAHLFDDFVTGISSANVGMGGLGWRNSGNNGGGVSGFVSGSGAPGMLGHLGIVQLLTGTTNNSTGQGLIDLQTTQAWPGVASSVTMACEIQTPAALAVGGAADYIIEMGFGVYPYEQSTSGAVIQYNRAVSTKWTAYTSQNGSFTAVSNAGLSAITTSTWYIIKIVMVSGSVSFYVAPGGSTAYTLIGTSVTNLPTSAFTANPHISIYKTTTSSAVSTTINIDWCSFDYTFTSLR